MQGLNRLITVFFYGKPCDMCKGFNRLYALVRGQMQLDPLSGHLFVFINGGRNLVKVLPWDGDGLAVLYKWLEKGTFKRPTARISAPNSELLTEELYMILRCIDLEKTKKRKRYLSG
jgi:transposase